MIPRINDITTSFDPAPEFETLSSRYPKRDYSYPSAFREQQERAYPDIQPLRLPISPEDAYESAVLAVNEEEWDIVSTDEGRLRIEAVATTPLLRFKDDIVIEIKQLSEEESEVHMRSKSRLGKSDLGTNAKRIQRFFDQLRAS